MAEKKLSFIENEGALFLGVSRGNPEFVWWAGNPGRWVPYSRDVPKPVDWGTILSDEEAKAEWPEAYAVPPPEAAQAAE